MDLIEQRDRLADRELSSVELVEQSLERIEQTADSLNAFKLSCPDQARSEAAEADRRLAAGDRAPLLGVPIAVKDDTDIAGLPTAFGTPGEHPAKTEDAEVVRRLRRAGAVIVGKTNTPEFGQWPITEGPGFGVVRNPWNQDHTPGGSSGGSAAAVAAGIVAAALGSDGAGSVRIPASWTNLVGIKPQRGRISTWPDAEAFEGLTCFGPLARTVADAATLLDAAAGPHPGDRHTPAAPARPFASYAAEEPRRLRIALSFAIPFSGAPAQLDPQVRARVRSLAQTAAASGHEIEEADPAYGPIGLSFFPRSMAGIRQWRGRMPDPTRLDPRTRMNARTGTVLGTLPLRAARAAERGLRARVGSIFKRFDLIIAPTTAQPPLRCGAIDGLGEIKTNNVIVGACPYAWPWNVLGLPAISVPAGFVDGLPVGAQLIGPHSSEPLLISLAAQLERERCWYEQRPEVKLSAVGPSA